MFFPVPGRGFPAFSPFLILFGLWLFPASPAPAHGLFGHSKKAPKNEAKARPEAGFSVSRGPQNPWTHERFHNDPAHFQFAIVTDRTGGHRPGIFEDAVGKLNLLRPEFVMSVGDLIEGYTRDTVQLAKEWTEFNGFVKGLHMPFFYVTGNHDVSNEVQLRFWEKQFGRSFYHFVYKDVLFLAVRSTEPDTGRSGHRVEISPEQTAYIRRALEENKNVKWTLVFFHHPLWHEKALWPGFKSLFAGRKTTFYAGHFHHYSKTVEGEADCYVLGTTGGGSAMRGPLFGEFDHFAWITMTPEGPVMANLLLDGIWPDSMAGSQVPDWRKNLGGALNPRAVQLERIAARRQGSVPDTVRVRLTNDADLPMKVELKPMRHPQLRTDPGYMAVTVPPNSVEWMDYLLEARRAPAQKRTGSGPSPGASRSAPGPMPDLRPIEIRFGLSFDIPQDKRLKARIEGSRFLGVELPFSIPQVKKAPQVDADLADWGPLPFACDTPVVFGFTRDAWKGPLDGSFRFGVGHDARYLYVAMEARDDSATMAPDSIKPWYQDGLELRVDARPDSLRNAGTGKNEGKDFLFLGVCPRENPDSSVWVNRDSLPPGILLVARRQGGKLSAEFAVPRSYLDSLQGGPWKAVRLNFSFGDFDGAVRDRTRATQLLWRPDWRSKESYPGSGTFRRGS